jgi:pentatricopeptide repeat protein
MCQHSTEAGELTGVEAQMVAARADHRRVLELFDGAERGAVNTRMVNLVLSAELELGTDADTAAVRMLQRCTAHGLEPTAALHNNVLGAMSRSSPPEVVISWIRRMAESGVRLDALACNMQLKAYLAMGDQAKAMSLLSAMMNTTDDALPKPDVVSFNTVITYLAHAAKPSQAEAVLTTMLDGASCTADVHSFTAVINAFARASEPAAAAKWLQRMLESPSVVPDAAAFNATLSAYANAGDADGAARVFAAFEAHAMDNCPNAKPDHVSCAAAPPSPLAAPRPALLATAPLSLPLLTPQPSPPSLRYNTLIHACAKAGRPADAEAAFARMQSKGISADALSYSSVVSSHAKAGAPAAAQQWLDRMVAAGIAPDAVAYNTVCSAHARVGDARSALATFRAMEVAGIAASSTTHAIICNALVQAGELAQAEAGLRSLVARGDQLSASSFNALISAHAKAKQPAAAAAVRPSPPPIPHHPPAPRGVFPRPSLPPLTTRPPTDPRRCSS